MHTEVIILALLAGQAVAGVVSRAIVTEYELVTTVVTIKPVTVVVTPTQTAIHTTTSHQAGAAWWLPGPLGHIPIYTSSSSTHTTPKSTPSTPSKPAHATLSTVATTVHTTEKTSPTTSQAPAVTTPHLEQASWNAVFGGFGSATFVTI